MGIGAVYQTRLQTVASRVRKPVKGLNVRHSRGCRILFGCWRSWFGALTCLKRAIRLNLNELHLSETCVTMRLEKTTNCQNRESRRPFTVLEGVSRPAYRCSMADSCGQSDSDLGAFDTRGAIDRTTIRVMIGQKSGASENDHVPNTRR